MLSNRLRAYRAALDNQPVDPIYRGFMPDLDHEILQPGETSADGTFANDTDAPLDIELAPEGREAAGS